MRRGPSDSSPPSWETRPVGRTGPPSSSGGELSSVAPAPAAAAGAFRSPLFVPRAGRGEPRAPPKLSSFACPACPKASCPAVSPPRRAPTVPVLPGSAAPPGSPFVVSSPWASRVRVASPVPRRGLRLPAGSTVPGTGCPPAGPSPSSSSPPSRRPGGLGVSLLGVRPVRPLDGPGRRSNRPSATSFPDATGLASGRCARARVCRTLSRSGGGGLGSVPGVDRGLVGLSASARVRPDQVPWSRGCVGCALA